MRIRSDLPSAQLMVTLFVCACATLTLQNFYADTDLSFSAHIIVTLVFLLILALLFVPSFIIRKRTGTDFITFATKVTPSAIIFVTSFYALYFVYAATFLLSEYIEMIKSTLNPNAEVYSLSFLLLATCVYGAYKGINAITRSSIFIFAFAILAFLLIFFGNISNIELNNSTFGITGSTKSYADVTAYFLSSAVIAVIFGFTSGKTRQFKTHHIVITLVAIAVLFALTSFFVCFVLGEYGTQQSFQFFMMSKTSHLGVVSGIDSFYLALSTASVFLFVSMIIVCLNKSVGKINDIKITALFSLIIYVLFVCTNIFNSIKEILLNPYVLLVMTFFAAVVIPCGYIVFAGGNKND